MVIDADAEDGAGRDSGVSNARAVGRMARGGDVKSARWRVELGRRARARAHRRRGLGEARVDIVRVARDVGVRGENDTFVRIHRFRH